MIKDQISDVQVAEAAVGILRAHFLSQLMQTYPIDAVQHISMTKTPSFPQNIKEKAVSGGIVILLQKPTESLELIVELHSLKDSVS